MRNFTFARAPGRYGIVVPDCKRQSDACQPRRKQRHGILGHDMPRGMGVAALLEVENHNAGDLSVCFFNLEINRRKVIHFPVPGSRE